MKANQGNVEHCRKIYHKTIKNENGCSPLTRTYTVEEMN